MKLSMAFLLCCLFLDFSVTNNRWGYYFNQHRGFYGFIYGEVIVISEEQGKCFGWSNDLTNRDVFLIIRNQDTLVFVYTDQRNDTLIFGHRSLKPINNNQDFVFGKYRKISQKKLLRKVPLDIERDLIDGGYVN